MTYKRILAETAKVDMSFDHFIYIEDGSSKYCEEVNDYLTCTKIANHPGDHVAHGAWGRVIKRWPRGTPG